MIASESAIELDWREIEKAQARLAGIALHTSVLRSRHFDEVASCLVFLKAENMQRTGSARFRGAFNKIKAELETRDFSAVVTCSSGNFGQAVALTAKLLGLKATVFMPVDSSGSKIAATHGYGAEVILSDRGIDNCRIQAHEYSRRNGSLFVAPTEDLLTIAGEATIVLELMEEIPDLDVLLVPVEPGGLLAGSAVAAHNLNPELLVYGVDLIGRVPNPGMPEADGSILSVSRDELIGTQVFILERMKVLVETAGCAAAASVLFRKRDFSGRRVGVILSGGNTDFPELSKALLHNIPEIQPKPQNEKYRVTCFFCGAQYDAIDTIWCNCLSTERTLVCPKCLHCFCRAGTQYKNRFWENAPQEMWDRKHNEQVRTMRFGRNPDPWPVKRPFVLIVDHDSSTRRLAHQMIDQLGYGVILADNGEEGLVLAKRYSPDLILTDALMPRLDGREMCLRLKNDPTTANIKVIVTTALYTQAKYRSEAFRRFHVDEYLSKPVSFLELQTLLQKYLN